jgi:hypothetical protein
VPLQEIPNEVNVIPATLQKQLINLQSTVEQMQKKLIESYRNLTKDIIQTIDTKINTMKTQLSKEYKADTIENGDTNTDKILAMFNSLQLSI